MMVIAYVSSYGDMIKWTLTQHDPHPYSKKKCGHRDRHTEHHVKTKAAIRAMLLKVKECQRLSAYD